MLTPLNLQVTSQKTSGTSAGKSTDEGDGGFGALLNGSKARQSDEAGLPSSSLNTGSGSSDQRPTTSAGGHQSAGNTAQGQTASLEAGNGMTRSQRQALSETLERLQGSRLDGREHTSGRTQLSARNTDTASRTLADSTGASDGKTIAEALQRTSAENIVDTSDSLGKKLAASDSRLAKDVSNVTTDRDAVIDEKRLRAAESDNSSDSASLYGLVDAAALTQQPQVRDGVRGTESASATRRTGVEQALRGRDPADAGKAQGERTDSIRGERLFGEALQQKTDQQSVGFATGFDQILSQHNGGAGTSDTAMNTLSALTGQSGLSVANATTTTGQAVTTAMLPAMDSDQWAPALERQVISLSLRGGGEARLDLNPAELGPLSISLKMGEQSAQLHIASHHAQVRAAIEAALPQLRDAFNANGIELGQTSVSDQGSFQQGGFQQDQERSRDALAALNGVDSNGIAGQHSGDEIITINAPAGRALNGGIDLFA